LSGILVGATEVCVPHILLLEEDSELRLGMEQHLRKEGFSLTALDRIKPALRFLQQSASGHTARIDAVLLGLSLADGDGLDVLRAIRRDTLLRSLPVILVTRDSEDIDRVLGLEVGADDHLAKPFSFRELAARVRALLRRSTFIEGPGPGQRLRFAGIAVDLDLRAASVDGAGLDLTRREFELLTYFLKNPRRVLPREKILQQVWGLEYLGESRTIDAHVRRLRAKLGEAASAIETVVGVGYRLGSVDSAAT
jgi:DNA-binding response OmpR family regulator